MCPGRCAGSFAWGVTLRGLQGPILVEEKKNSRTELGDSSCYCPTCSRTNHRTKRRCRWRRSVHDLRPFSVATGIACLSKPAQCNSSRPAGGLSARSTMSKSWKCEQTCSKVRFGEASHGRRVLTVQPIAGTEETCAALHARRPHQVSEIQ